MAEMTLGRCICATHLLSATSLYLHSPLELPRNWRQITKIYNYYHSECIEISRVISILDIPYWQCQWVKMQTQFGDVSNLAQDMFSPTTFDIGREADLSLAWEFIGWWLWTTTADTFCYTVMVGLFGLVHNGSLVGDDPVLESKINK